MPDDTRRAPRVALVLRVEYPDAQQLAADYTLDIGAGGLFVHSEIPFEVGQAIELRLSFPGLLAPLEVSGTVRWRRRPDDPSGPCGIGVEFDPECTAGLGAFRRLLSRDEPARGRTVRVLLVEDSTRMHDLFRHALGQLLDAPGAQRVELRCAFDADGGYGELLTGTVDLVIVGLDLPGGSALELIRQLRGTPGLAGTPIVAVGSGAEVRADAFAAGADLCVDGRYLMIHLLGTLTALAAKPEASARAATIAVIDDSPLVLQVARGILGSRGFDVHTFESAMDFDPRAFEHLDLLLIDVLLTEFFGDDILAFLREELGLSARVLLYSQLPDEELARRAVACGAVGYVSKRSGPDGLVTAVEHALSAPDPGQGTGSAMHRSGTGVLADKASWF